MNKGLSNTHHIIRFLTFIVLVVIFFLLLDLLCIYTASYLSGKGLLGIIITLAIVGGFFMFLGIVVFSFVISLIEWLIKLYPYGGGAGLFAGFSVLNGLFVLLSIIVTLLKKSSIEYISGSIWCVIFLGFFTVTFIKKADNKQKMDSPLSDSDFNDLQSSKSSIVVAIWYKQALAQVVDVLIAAEILASLLHKSEATVGGGAGSVLFGYSAFGSFLDKDPTNNKQALDIFLCSVFITFLMTVIDLSFKGQSLGKYLFGLKIIRASNPSQKISSLRIVLRNLCRLIPLSVFSYIGKRPRGFLNKIAGTAVIDARLMNLQPPLFSADFKSRISKKFSKLFDLNSMRSKKLPDQENIEKLKELHELKKIGAITEEEYQSFKQKLLR